MRWSAGNSMSRIDAKRNATTVVFDARDRRLSEIDRIGAVTHRTYDAHGNELSMTDAELSTTSCEYDTRNQRVKTTWPDHQPGTVPGDADYGITETGYDAAGRITVSTDQRGQTATNVFDPAGRVTTREYRTAAAGPAGPIADQDVFTYDRKNGILSGVKGRYNNTVDRTYDAAGRLNGESLTISGQQ